MKTKLSKSFHLPHQNKTDHLEVGEHSVRGCFNMLGSNSYDNLVNNINAMEQEKTNICRKNLRVIYK